eukprot:212721-Pelagomonas_calceolata.AAC.4
MLVCTLCISTYTQERTSSEQLDVPGGPSGTGGGGGGPSAFAPAQSSGKRKHKDKDKEKDKVGCVCNLTRSNLCNVLIGYGNAALEALQLNFPKPQALQSVLHMQLYNKAL